MVYVSVFYWNARNDCDYVHKECKNLREALRYAKRVKGMLKVANLRLENVTMHIYE